MASLHYKLLLVCMLSLRNVISVCQNEHYGWNCIKLCARRHCAGVNSTCSPSTGQCDRGCRTGWAGVDCTVCDHRHYGPNCTGLCVARHCVGLSSCRNSTGQCDMGCQTGWTGIDCRVYNTASQETTITTTPVTRLGGTSDGIIIAGVVAAVLACILVVVAVVGVVVWRRRRSNTKNGKNNAGPPQVYDRPDWTLAGLTATTNSCEPVPRSSAENVTDHVYASVDYLELIDEPEDRRLMHSSNTTDGVVPHGDYVPHESVMPSYPVDNFAQHTYSALDYLEPIADVDETPQEVSTDQGILSQSNLS